MGRKIDWKGVFPILRKPWVMTMGGLVLGALGAGLFVVLLNYVIQPKMSVETRDIYMVGGDRFNVWYHDGSPHRAGYVRLNARLEESLDELLERLDVDPADIPRPIDVLVHDDKGQLQSSIAQRKSPTATHTFFAVVDLLGGEDPYARLTELVVAFGWGECFSQLLYDGALSILVDPDYNPHPAVAAAPSRLRYSFEDLVRLEAAGEFEPTIYQRFDSPFSSNIAFGSLENIATFYSVFGGETSLVREQDFASLHAASLVAYLVQCSGGLDGLRSVWGPGSSVALFGRLACCPLDELSESWWSAAEAEGTTGAEYEYYRALYLFEGGDFAEAHRLTQAWEGRGLREEDIVLAVRCALSVGEFDEAEAWAEKAGSSRDQLSRWVAAFDGWVRVEGDGITVLGGGPPERLSELLTEVQAARRRIAAGLSLNDDRLPGRMTVFQYSDAAARQEGEGVTPGDAANQTAWHVVAGEPVAWTLATTLPAYAYGVNTASNLLRSGLATALTVEVDDLLEQGCAVLVDGNWTPLWQLGFGSLSPHLLRVESGLMIRYLIDTVGDAVIPDLWRATARLGGGMSLDSAMLEFAGTSRRDVERALLNSVLVCD